MLRALTGETVNIENVYQHEGFDFQGTRYFDSHTSCRSRSMPVVPMKDHEDETLTASDRPYKKRNTLSETMGIKDLHIDPDIFQLFKKEGLHEEYARHELAAKKDGTG